MDELTPSQSVAEARATAAEIRATVRRIHPHGDVPAIDFRLLSLVGEIARLQTALHRCRKDYQAKVIALQKERS